MLCTIKAHYGIGLPVYIIFEINRNCFVRLDAILIYYMSVERLNIFLACVQGEHY